MLFLLSFGCTLTFEQKQKPAEKSAALLSLEAAHCSAGLYRHFIAYLVKQHQLADCAALLAKLDTVDYLDLSGGLAKAPRLLDEVLILKDFPAIIHLKLSNNQLESIAPLAALTQLRYLYLDHNHLTSLEPLRHHALLWLDASYNQLTSLEPILGMPSLKDLYLEGNSLAVIPEQRAWPQLMVLRY